MRYIVFNVATTRYMASHRGVRCDQTSFVNMGAAKAALTREVNRGSIKREDFNILPFDEFKKIEKTETVIGLGNGTVVPPYEISVNTPISCDPRSETYWSM